MKYVKIPAMMARLLSAACTTTAPPYSGRQIYRYQQFTILPGTAATECKTAATNVANSLADRRRREIEPVDDERIKLNTGRNWYGKVTACSATAPIVWKR